MARSRAARTLVLSLALAAGLAACGGDEPAGGDAAGTATPAATATATATPMDCGFVAYVPDSDAGAFQITASGVDCGTARAVATAAEGEGRAEAGGAFEAEGFACTGTFRDTALPSTEWTCTRGEARVTFSTS